VRVTLKVIHRLQAFSNAIVEHLCSILYSSSALAQFLVYIVANDIGGDTRTVGKGLQSIAAKTCDPLSDLRLMNFFLDSRFSETHFPD